MRVLVVGGGLTGAVVARTLRAALPGADVHVWEAEASVGGRMFTPRFPNHREEDADLGAQYISCTGGTPPHTDLLEALVSKGVLREMTVQIGNAPKQFNAPRHHVAPKGFAHLVAHILHDSGAHVHTNTTLTALAQSASRWAATSPSRPTPELFDAVVLTQPPHLSASVPGVPSLLDEATATRLRALQFSQRFAMGLQFRVVGEGSAGEALRAAVGAAVRYVDDPIVRYVCVDSLRRGSGQGEESATLVVHSSVAFGLERSGVALPTVREEMERRVRQLFPALPWPPVDVVFKHWAVSQVRRPLEMGEGAAGAMLLGGDRDAAVPPPLVVASDAMSGFGSCFDGCVQAGTRAARLVVGALDGASL